MKIIFLTPEAYSGIGGIAQYGRDFIGALCAHGDVESVEVVPRLIRECASDVPEKVVLPYQRQRNALGYVLYVLRRIIGGGKVDVVFCGHIHLVPLAVLLGIRYSAPVVLLVYGIDVFEPTSRRLVRICLAHVGMFVAMSELTRARFSLWSGLQRYQLIPNGVDLFRFSPGPRSRALADRYRLNGRRVLLTIGRLCGTERYKGMDEIIEVLPRLIRHNPELVYMIVGDGDDRRRLEMKVQSLNIQSHVIFTGYVDESEKVDHIRLADVYVMPSRFEGFGFVFLEAVACGVPTVGSSVDGSREALRDGKLGILVDPNDPESIFCGILEALNRPRGSAPEGVEYFALGQFRERVGRLIESLKYSGRQIEQPRTRRDD